ncbi:WD40-repeat-containing domain protein [Suillus discolor]|uniref:WD40-repeat-containing domain protein n=1 Tax=Suillus discolor TaxID=1912936 RepID=A0A9P7ESB4_9AGAM|nr:WD40-repeat-containing domain protein [Suillus discolor]KAG2086452.1 WD40-repeat-containing domain protein [Suillus discolor]
MLSGRPASISSRPIVLVKESTLTPVLTLGGHGDTVSAISYFPDGKRIISGSNDKTTREWDLEAGKEVEEAQDICKQEAHAVGVSRDGRWVVSAGGDFNIGELKVCEVETGTVRAFEGHSMTINSIDISGDSILLASGSLDGTTRIWSLETGKLVAGPFNSINWVNAVRFSQDSKKLTVISSWGNYLEVWDVRSQKLDVHTGNPSSRYDTYAPVFWTTEDKTIVITFSLTDTSIKTVYEFDAPTLETIGAPFEGHTQAITGLALSLDCALLASASYDNPIKNLFTRGAGNNRIPLIMMPRPRHASCLRRWSGKISTGEGNITSIVPNID